jgi:serine protease
MTSARCITNRFVAALLALAPASQTAGAADTAAPPAPRERVMQFIVKIKTQSAPQSVHTSPGDGEARAALARRVVERVLRENPEKLPIRSRRAADFAVEARPMSGAAHIVTLASPLTDVAAAALAERLQMQPEIEYAEPDYRLHRQLMPTDPLYAKQWAYRGDSIGAARFEAAWDITTGSSDVVIAVADTGYRPHPDLMAHLLPGYDFISDPFFANDGDGRDADASDPGDWVTAEESVRCDGTDLWTGNSSWHGTHVAGTIGAVANNEIGGAGGVGQARILPVRVLGKCGGAASDIIDGMRWAAGLPVPGVHDNPHPAKIVNVSLGSAQPCSRAMQAAIDDIVAHGASVVAAAGNGGFEVGEPASCHGAIAVAAIDAGGEKGAFSNSGARIDIGAPGVGIVSTANAGLTVPGEDTYLTYNGTSMAAPHVSAALALMLAVKPTLSPEALREKIKTSASAYPAASSCGKTKEAAICGVGMLDAAAAVAAASTAQKPEATTAD